MKKILFFLSIAALITLFSCSKEKVEKRECESQNIGYITITNTSDNPYNIYIDGIFKFQLSGNTFEDDYEVNSGTHVFKAKQVSGYILYPTVVEITTYIGQCEKKSWVVP